jgi:hypothetical protein
VKVRAVEFDNRRRSFRVASDRGVFDFPYAKTYPPLARNERVNSAWPDPELGNEAFTFQLESGREDSVHMDSVLEYNEDPETLQRILLHRLTVEAKQAVREGSLSKRELVRRLGTSATQLYRLLDPANYTKSVDQMFILLRILGKSVDVVVR